MDDLARKLLDTHVRHELDHFRNRGYEQTIREEVAAFFEWIKRIKLSDIVTPEQIIGIIQRNVIERPVADGAIEMAEEMSRKVHASPRNKKTVLEDILTLNQFNDGVAKAGELRRARKAVIHQIVTSTAYSRQISEVLYTGIKDYMLTENIFARKIPGVSSLIKMGSFAVNKTLHPLEMAVERTIKNYIESNLGSTIRRSEKSLNDYLDRHHAEIGGEIWDTVAKKKLSELFSGIDEDDLDDFIHIGRDFWLHFRRTPYFREICNDLVHLFFKKYGKRDISVLFRDMGVTQEIAAQELIAAVSTGVESALENGYLEERLRTRFETFYFSPETAELLSVKKKDAKKKSAALDAVEPSEIIASEPVAPKKPRRTSKNQN